MHKINLFFLHSNCHSKQNFVHLKMASLKQLKQLSGKNKFLVFGFIRTIEKESKMITIPMLIFYNILGYYHLNEYFSKCCDEIEISPDKMTITITKKAKDQYSELNNNSYGSL